MEWLKDVVVVKEVIPNEVVLKEVVLKEVILKDVVYHYHLVRMAMLL
jgi:hypothetical protein